MAHPFEIKRGDLLPIIRGAVLNRSTGEPLDLASAPYPRFIMRASGAANAVISATAGATVLNASQGQVGYLWSGSDTATAGYYEAEFELTFPGAKKQTAPSNGYQAVSIKVDLG